LGIESFVNGGNKGKSKPAGAGGKNKYAPSNDHINARSTRSLRNRIIMTTGQINNIRYAKLLGIDLILPHRFSIQLIHGSTNSAKYSFQLP